MLGRKRSLLHEQVSFVPCFAARIGSSRASASTSIVLGRTATLSITGASARVLISLGLEGKERSG